MPSSPWNRAGKRSGAGARHCPLCREKDLSLFHSDGCRCYLICACCALVFVPAEEHLSPEEERREYDRHQNRVDDPGYRRFLNRLAQPLLLRLRPGAQGLDFGCGPGPALALILAESGHQVALYDPFYAPDSSVLDHRYDFITLTEVAEHLRSPSETWSRLARCLAPGGVLAVMSKRVLDRERFRTWHYIRDPTHISFYHSATLGWLAAHFSWQLELISADIAFFTARDEQSLFPDSAQG